MNFLTIGCLGSTPEILIELVLREAQARAFLKAPQGFQFAARVRTLGHQYQRTAWGLGGGGGGIWLITGDNGKQNWWDLRTNCRDINVMTAFLARGANLPNHFISSVSRGCFTPGTAAFWVKIKKKKNCFLWSKTVITDGNKEVCDRCVQGGRGGGYKGRDVANASSGLSPDFHLMPLNFSLEASQESFSLDSHNYPQVSGPWENNLDGEDFNITLRSLSRPFWSLVSDPARD